MTGRCFAEGFSVWGPIVPCPDILTFRTCSCGPHQHQEDMELNRPPGVKNVLVLGDHFMRYAMAFHYQRPES